MQDLSTLSNDELFKLCKSSGISAGPITQSTRSVYEKKLLRHLNEVTDSSEKKPLEKPAEIQSPIVILKANLQQTTENSQVESPKFVKPSTPKAKPQQQPEQETYSEKPTRRSIAKTSTEERTFEVTVDKKGLMCLFLIHKSFYNLKMDKMQQIFNQQLSRQQLELIEKKCLMVCPIEALQ